MLRLQLLEKSVAHPPVPAAPSAVGGEAKREGKPPMSKPDDGLGRSETGSKDSNLGKLSYHLEQMK